MLPARPHGSQDTAPNTPEQVRDVMRRAGLAVVDAEEVPCPFVYQDVETAWRALGATGLFRHAIGALGVAVVRAEFDRHFPAPTADSRVVRHHNVFEFSIGKTLA
jgi:hypothetical protein